MIDLLLRFTEYCSMDKKYEILSRAGKFVKTLWGLGTEEE